MKMSCSKFLAISFFTVMLAAFSNGWKNRRTRLEVVDRYGPHGGEEQVMSLDDILAMDQLRVQSLQLQEAAADTNINNNNYTNQKHQVQIPAESAKSLGSGNYVVKIGLGSPAHELSLVIDTGSDVSWTQCHPCFKNDCFLQKERMFRPSESRTYARIPCENQYCTDLGNKKRGGPGCAHLNHDCTYIVRYGDGSNTTGFYGSDRLTLSPFEKLPNFRFGCGNHNMGLFGRYAGIFGLGRGPASFVSQRKYTYGRVFSYCLPDVNSRGFLSFGPGEDYNHEPNMVFTPFVPRKNDALSSSFYYIEITGIHVGGIRLRIPLSVFTATDTIIDSGAVLTHLPPAAYEELAKEYTRQIGSHRSARAYSRQLSTCFNVTKDHTIPTLTFTFKGDATVPIAPSGILRFVKPDWACLVFDGNKKPGDMAIFGNTVQTKIEVMYDVPKNRLGFRSNPGCF